MQLFFTVDTAVCFSLLKNLAILKLIKIDHPTTTAMHNDKQLHIHVLYADEPPAR